MKRLMKRFLKWSLLTLIAGLVIITSLCAWVYTTEAGVKWAWNHLKSFQPEAISVREISGRLNDTLLIQDSYWRQPDLTVKVPQITLQCEWFDLFKSVLNCDSIDVSSVIISSHRRNREPSKEGELPDLPQFELPFALDISSLKVNQVRLNKFEGDDLLVTENTFSSIQLKRLKYQRSAFSFKKLSLKTDQFEFQGAGKFKPNKDWSHQLDIKLNSPNLSLAFSSEGKLNVQSRFKLSTIFPIELESSGNWHWSQGPYISNMIWEGKSQKVTLRQQELSLDELRGRLEMNWPSFNADLSIIGSWQQFKKVKLSGTVSGPDLRTRNKQSQFDLLIGGELSEKLLRDSFPSLFVDNRFPPTQSSDKNWPVVSSLNVTFNNDTVQLQSHKLQVGELSGKLNGSMRIQPEALDSLKLNAELGADRLDLPIDLALRDFSINVDYSYHHDNWSVTTQGRAGTIQHPVFATNNLAWNVTLDKSWNGRIQAKDIQFGQSMFEQPNLSVKGNARKHQLVFSTLVKKLIFSDRNLTTLPAKNNLDSKLQQAQITLNGNLENESGVTQWTADDVHAFLPLASTDFSLSADKIVLGTHRQVKNLCLKNTGKVCVSGRYSAHQWSADLQFERWPLSPLANIASAYLPSPEIHVYGAIDGSADLAGNADQLERLRLELLVPELRIKSFQTESVWQQLSIQSLKDTPAHKVSVSWLEQQQLLKSADWITALNMPKGQLLIDLKSSEAMDFKLVQKNINWALLDATSNEAKTAYAIPELKLDVDLRKKEFTSELKLNLLENDHIAVEIASIWPIMPDSKINGSIDLFVSQFDWLKQWRNNIDIMDLNFTEKAVLSGTWKSPLIKGKGRLAVNHFTLEDLGVDIKDSFLNVTNDNERMTIQGRLRNRTDELNLKGSATLGPDFSASLKLVGDKVTLVYDENNKVIISPNLSATFVNNHFNVDGKIVVDQAKLKISALPKQAIEVSSDQNLIGQSESKATVFDYNVVLSLLTGPGVHFEGVGVNSGINGALVAQAQLNKALSLNGHLDLKNGTFEAYKQKLVIEEGQLLFLGTAENPGIQFKASRTIDEIKVGIIADGSLANPRLTLYSTPAMAEENILALLLTGRSIESLSQSEGNALANAAIGIGVEGANIIAQKIGAALGIKNLSVSSKTSADSTRIDIGAQISDRLNVSYGTTINSQKEMQAGWVIEYILSPSISFEAVSGEDISASINYKKQLEQGFWGKAKNDN